METSAWAARSGRRTASGRSGWRPGVNAGMVWVNKHLDPGLDIPFAGAKQSGIGVELGQEGLEEFTQSTIINMAK
jgi:acyl-CoA reductase-like NAD-dependent aldehyde dehydrogenase